MGFLSIFSKSARPELLKLPSGSFTVDAKGSVVASTLPQNFPAPLVKELTQAVLGTFRDAKAAKTTLTELIIDYPGLRLTARELRGGAIIFLAPRTLSGR